MAGPRGARQQRIGWGSNAGRARARSADYGADQLDAELEKAWQATVLEIAETCGWQRRYHTYDSRRSTPGFPDLCLCRPPRLLFAEVKREDGRVSRDQWGWYDDLKRCGVEVYIWRPSDRDEVDRVLASRRRP
jgi:hypothetical protein